MTTRTATCRCGQFRVTTSGEPGRVSVGAFADPSFPTPAFSVWEERKHGWVAVTGDAVEHTG